MERAIANCLEAIRRARTSMGSAGAKLDMNHVWLHVWPVIDAPLEQLTALKGTISPLTPGAGIEEVAAQGRVVAPDGSVHPSPPASPTSPARASWPTSAARRPSGSSRSTTTRRR